MCLGIMWRLVSAQATKDPQSEGRTQPPGLHCVTDAKGFFEAPGGASANVAITMSRFGREGAFVVVPVEDLVLPLCIFPW
ncbi:hypothetical protein Ancab_021311 [Ancistrocladus abbreviatus]